MEWLRSENDDIYDPSYTDMLRVAFTSEFKRGKLYDLVPLLSGRNFETKQFEESIAETLFWEAEGRRDEFHQRDPLQTIRDDHPVGGFRGRIAIGSQNAPNFAYIRYLTLREQGNHRQTSRRRCGGGL